MIAQLDQADFELAVKRKNSDLEQAKAQLVVMQSGEREEVIASLKAKKEAAEKQLETQRIAVDRAKRLVASRALARSQLEEAEAKFASDQANLDIAKKDLEIAQSGERDELVAAQKAMVRGLEAQLAQAQTDLENSTLRAPFDGMIATRNVSRFTNVGANEMVVVLQDLETIELRFDMPGTDVARFGRKTKDTVSTVRLDVAPDVKFESKVVEFGTEADPATQTFQGRARIDYPEQVTVLPGMTGSVIVSIPIEMKSGYVIPESALAAETGGAQYIWIVEQGKTVSKRKVTAEKMAGGKVMILGDVKPGDVVVTAGVSYLREGMKVNPLSKRAD